jgi:hypothetical protein
MRRSQVALAACSVGWVALSKATLRVPRASLPTRLRWLDRVAALLPTPPPFMVADAQRAVTAIARRVPGTRCLEWALALRGVLAQGRIESQLRIGVAGGDGAAIRAHAWVECGGQAWSWGSAEGYGVLWPPRAPP